MFLCIIIITCSFLLSSEKVRKENMRIKIYGELIESLERMSAGMRFRSYDVYQLCEASFEGCEELSAFKNITGCFKTSWEEACSFAIKGIDQNTYSQLLSIGDFLGEYDLESQLQKLDYIASDIRKRLDKAEAEQTHKKKLYYSVGLFIGMMICLILI